MSKVEFLSVKLINRRVSVDLTLKLAVVNDEVKIEDLPAFLPSRLQSPEQTFVIFRV